MTIISGVYMSSTITDIRLSIGAGRLVLVRNTTRRRTKMTETNSTTRVLKGSCHCGKVLFEVRADPERGASRCNCSLCTKLGGVRALVKPEAFELKSDP